MTTREFERQSRRDTYAPPSEEVEGLIQRARQHPLGTDFLVEGTLDAVAATFEVHAFTVEKARRVLDT